MKIVVCVKQVVTRESHLRLDESQRWIREQDASYEMNEPDAYALEEALRLKEKHGGEVVVCSAGPARVQQLLREALARGADRAIHVEDQSLVQADASAVAGSIADAIREEAFDLVLTGLQSDDHGFGQVGVVLAERLDVPHATIIMEVQVQDSTLRVKRELESGWFQWMSMPLPALLTIQSGINQLRYATLKGIMAAKKKEIRKVTPSPLDVARGDPERVEGSTKSRAGQRTLRLYVPERTKQTVLIPGTPAEAAKELVRVLRDEVRVL